MEIAERIATQAHAGQTDKAGRPYIEHPRRVAAALGNHPQARAAALLHDVLEDTTVTEEDLASQGVPREVIETVKLLTRSKDVTPETYYATIRREPLALAVKLADIYDNLDPDRRAALPQADQARLQRKYETALAALGLPGASRDQLPSAIVDRLAQTGA